MTLEVRRIVTGHDEFGKGIVVSDEKLTAVSRGRTCEPRPPGWGQGGGLRPSGPERTPAVAEALSAGRQGFHCGPLQTSPCLFGYRAREACRAEETRY
jgi:hypothetical protein